MQWNENKKSSNDEAFRAFSFESPRQYYTFKDSGEENLPAPDLSLIDDFVDDGIDDTATQRIFLTTLRHKSPHKNIIRDASLWEHFSHAGEKFLCVEFIACAVHLTPEILHFVASDSPLS